jgi:hypothetical protein
MILSFGHIHPEDLGLPATGTDHTRLASNIPTAPVTPAGRDHPAPVSDDYCAICASMALVATAIPSLPPVLIAPERIRPVWPTEIPARIISAKFARSFQARGPPIL